MTEFWVDTDPSSLHIPEGLLKSQMRRLSRVEVRWGFVTFSTSWQEWSTTGRRSQLLWSLKVRLNCLISNHYHNPFNRFRPLTTKGRNAACGVKRRNPGWMYHNHLCFRPTCGTKTTIKTISISYCWIPQPLVTYKLYIKRPFKFC